MSSSWSHSRVLWSCGHYHRLEPQTLLALTSVTPSSRRRGGVQICHLLLYLRWKSDRDPSFFDVDPPWSITMVIPRDYNRPSGNLQCQPAHNNNRLSGNLRHTSHPHLQGHANINDASSSNIRNPTTRVVDNVASCQPAPPHSYSHHEGMRDQSHTLHPYSGRDSDSNGLMTPMSATNNKTTSSLIS